MNEKTSYKHIVTVVKPFKTVGSIVYLTMKGRRGGFVTACRATWGIFGAIWEAHWPSEGSSGDEVGTAGVHQWQRVGAKRVQGRPYAPKYMFHNEIKATPKGAKEMAKGPRMHFEGSTQRRGFA